jgi:predicted RNA-binding protein with RPS1 domain
LEGFRRTFFKGVEYRGSVAWIESHGVVVKLEAGPQGLIHISKLPKTRPIDSFKPGERVVVRIIRIEREAQKLAMEFVADVEDEEEPARRVSRSR